MQDNLTIKDILLMESTFVLKNYPEEELYINETVISNVIFAEDNDITVIQHVSFVIKEIKSERIIATLLLRYGFNIIKVNKITKEEIEKSMFKKMQQFYINKANEFFNSAKLPLATEYDISVKLKSI